MEGLAPIDPRRLFNRALDAFAAKPVLAIILGLVLVVVPERISVWLMPADFDLWSVLSPSAFLPFLLFVALGALFAAWAAALTYRLATGAKAPWPQATLGRLVLGQIVVVLGVLLGILLLFIPGIYWSLLTIVVLPVILIEGETISGAVRRSAVLTRGRRLAILGYWLVWYVPLTLMMAGAEQLLVDFRGIEAANTSSLVLNWVRPMSTLLGVLAHAFFTASLYCELRQLADQANVPATAAAPTIA